MMSIAQQKGMFGGSGFLGTSASAILLLWNPAFPHTQIAYVCVELDGLERTLTFPLEEESLVAAMGDSKTCQVSNSQTQPQP